jgi:hypothetical protein
MTTDDTGTEDTTAGEIALEELTARASFQLAELRTTTDSAAIAFRVKRAAYVRHSGRLTSEDLVIATGDGNKNCEFRHLTDVAGTSITGPDGASKPIALSRLVCGPVVNVGDPVSLVATPLTNRPVYLTTTINIQHSGYSEVGEVEFRVFAWGPNGNPRPEIPFSFRIAVPAYVDIPTE